MPVLTISEMQKIWRTYGGHLRWSFTNKEKRVDDPRGFVSPVLREDDWWDEKRGGVVAVPR